MTRPAVTKQSALSPATLAESYQPAHPESAYLKAFLLRIREGFSYTTQLCRFLVRHPLLVIELGFRLHLDPSQPYGFDVQKTVPSDYWLREHLRRFDPALLQALLQSTVRALKEEIPGLGETVACDVKHIYAWVCENNPQVYVKGPFNVSYRCQGDPDCRLGVKKSSNQDADEASQQASPDASKTSTHQQPAVGSNTKSKKEKKKKVSLFGYGTGVAACTDPVSGDSVLAEYTLPFNQADVTYYRPLFQRTVVALNQFPIYISADAAYDYWYVYETVAQGPSLPDTFHMSGKAPRKWGENKRAGSPRAVTLKEGNSSLQGGKPSSLAQEEFHEPLQSSIKSLARTSQAILYDVAWPSNESPGHGCAGSDARRKYRRATGGRRTARGKCGQSH